MNREIQARERGRRVRGSRATGRVGRGGPPVKTPVYLTLADIADRAGIALDSARTYHKRATSNRAAGNPRPGDLPPEDIRLGITPGWAPETIDRWLAGRPRKGARRGPAPARPPAAGAP